MECKVLGALKSPRKNQRNLENGRAPLNVAVWAGPLSLRLTTKKMPRMGDTGRNGPKRALELRVG